MKYIIPLLLAVGFTAQAHTEPVGGDPTSITPVVAAITFAGATTEKPTTIRLRLTGKDKCGVLDKNKNFIVYTCGEKLEEKEAK